MALLWEVTRLIAVASLVTAAARGQGVTATGGITVATGAATSPDADVLDSPDYYPDAGGQLTVRYSGSAGSMTSYAPDGTLVQAQSAGASNGAYTSFSFTAFAHLGTGAWTVVYDPSGGNGGGGTATWTFSVGGAAGPCANDLTVTSVEFGGDPLNGTGSLVVGTTGSLPTGALESARITRAGDPGWELVIDQATPGGTLWDFALGDLPGGDTYAVELAWLCPDDPPQSISVPGTFQVVVTDDCENTSAGWNAGVWGGSGDPCVSAWTLTHGVAVSGAMASGSVRVELSRAGDPAYVANSSVEAHVGGASLPTFEFGSPVPEGDTYTATLYWTCSGNGGEPEVQVNSSSFSIDCGSGGGEDPGSLSVVDCIPDGSQTFPTLLNVTIPTEVRVAEVMRADAAGGLISTLYSLVREDVGCSSPTELGVPAGQYDVTVDTGFTADTPESTRYLVLRLRKGGCGGGDDVITATAPVLVPLCSGGGSGGSGSGEGDWDQAEIDRLLAAAEGTEQLVGELGALLESDNSAGVQTGDIPASADGEFASGVDGLAADIDWSDPGPLAPYALVFRMPDGSTQTLSVPIDSRGWDLANPTYGALDGWRQIIRDLLVLVVTATFVGSIWRALRSY